MPEPSRRLAPGFALLNYAYIVGLSHSGSTLLAFLLNAHPEILSNGETSRIGEILPDRWIKKSDLCSCGQRFYDCPFWNRTLAGLAARGFGLVHSDPFDHPLEERPLAQRKLRAFVESALEASQKRVYADASKVSNYAPLLADNPHLEVRFINLVRDGRGVIASWKKRLQDAPIERVIQEWVRQEKHRRAQLQRLQPDRIFHLKYEELCSQPDAVLERVFAFLGVDAGVTVSAGYKTTVEHHVIGNPMRLSADESIELDERWRRELSAETLEAFAQSGAERINGQNGYAD